MSSTYPEDYDDFPVHVDATVEQREVIRAADINALGAAIEAIQVELGLAPSGSADTVAARIDTIADQGPVVFEGTSTPTGDVDDGDLWYDPSGPSASSILFVGSDGWLKFHAAPDNVDALIVGVITRNASGAATSAGVVWPDGTSGTYTATTVSSAFPATVDAYTVTYLGSPTKTVTQPAVTRNSTTGVVTTRPAMIVS